MRLPRFSELTTASKISLFAVFVLTLGVFVAVQGALQTQEQRSRASTTNIIKNASFESGTGGWQLNKRAGNGTFSINTGDKTDGAASGQLAITTSTANPADLELAQYGVPVTAGQNYTLVFWAKASGNRPIDVVVQQSVSPYTEYKRQTFSLTTGWQQFTYTFVAPSTQSNTFVGFQVAKTTGTVLLDNIQFYQGTPVSLPAAPTGLQGVPGDKVVNLSWNAVSGATGYYVHYRDVTAGQTTFNKWANPVTGTSTQSIWMNNGSKYEFKLSAVNSAGEGPTSAVISVTLPAPQPTVTPTKTPTPTPTKTPTPTPTKTPTPTPTKTPTPTPSETPSLSPTQTPTTGPTATTAPNATTFGLILKLHGLGKGGDSANPNGSGTFDLTRPQRTVLVELYNTQNQLVVSKQGTVNFNQTTGKFAGSVDMGTNIPNGFYTVKIKTPQFLRASVPGILSVTAGQANQLPETTLISGDINGDNTISILDYNILLGCYSEFAPAVDCTEANKALADIDDDGSVGSFDMNLFLRELTVRGGE